jgi:3-dehydrotetronate 4-kinase
VLTKGGMRTVQYSGIPQSGADSGVEAGIIALKSRTIPPAEAVAQSLAALGWLQAQGCRQILFKYCSTFDSTPEGNIGPVAEALAEALDARHVVVCPAFPTLKRSVFNGHLFVGDRLLSESGMENHPLTPMTDPDLRRWLARQSSGSVGHIPAATVLAGRAAIRAALTAPDGPRLVVVDCVRDEDLVEIGAASAGEPLITGGSGIALGLPEVFRARGEIGTSRKPWAPVDGPVAILSGSCSTATRG